MITVYAPVLALAFAPILLIEAWWLSNRQPAVSFRTSIQTVFIANVWSTLAGMPIAWIASPYDAPKLLIPFLLVSVFIEYKSLKYLLREFEVQRLGTTVWVANILSYALLIGIWILFSTL